MIYILYVIYEIVYHIRSCCYIEYKITRNVVHVKYQYILYCKVYSVYSVLVYSIYSIKYTVCGIDCTLYSVYHTLYTAHCILYIAVLYIITLYTTEWIIQRVVL